MILEADGVPAHHDTPAVVTRRHCEADAAAEQVQQWLEAPLVWVPTPGLDHAVVLLGLVLNGHHIHDPLEPTEVVRTTGEKRYRMSQRDSADLQSDDAGARPSPSRADSGIHPAADASCRTVERQDFEGGFDQSSKARPRVQDRLHVPALRTRRGPRWTQHARCQPA